MIPIFNGNYLTRGDIAQFARSVDACAKEGDATAIAILESAGHSLAQYAVRLLCSLPQPQIGIYGGVLLHNQKVYSTFENDVLTVIPNAQILHLTNPPEYGAVLFAADGLGIERDAWTWKDYSKS